MKNGNPRGCKAPGFLINSFAFTPGAAPLTRLTFFITEKDPAGRTLQAAPCRPPLQKASTPSVYSWGCTPNPPYFFHCKKVSKKLAP